MNNIEYTTENPFSSAKEYLKAPLFEKYQVRRAIIKSTTALFPFMLFAALFAFVVIPLGNVFEALQAGLYWVSYMSIQLFGIGFAVMLAYDIAGFMSALSAGVLSAYFGLFCTQVAGVETISGSSVIGFVGYFLIGLLSAAAVSYLHRVCVVVVEWLLGLGFKFINNKITDEAKREGIFVNLRPMLKNMVLLGDSLIVLGIASYIVFFAINYLYALPMTVLAHTAADFISNNSSITAIGAVIGLSVGFDVGGPVSLAVFDVIFKGLLAGSTESARLMTVFTCSMITPSWICLFYWILGKKFKGWPFVCYDENLLNTGFINEVFQNTRLMAMSPMAYALRELKTVPFAYIIGTGITGTVAAALNFTNTSLLEKYACEYGLLRKGTVIFTEKYDAFAGLMPPLFAGGGVKVKLLSFLSALIGAAIGTVVLIALKKLHYSRLEKRGEDLYLAFVYEFTKAEWDKKQSEKSKLEKRIFKDK